MKVFLYVLILLSFTSCVTVYIPTPHNSPMFVGEKEFQVAASAGTGLNLRSAYSLSRHCGITANYHDADNRFINRYLEATQWRKHRVGEIAFGYYSNMREKFYFDFFAGAGIGRGSAENTVHYSGWLWSGTGKDYYEGEASYNKLYLQSSIGLRRKRVSWNASARFSYVDFTHVYVTENNEELSFGSNVKSFLSAGSECRIAVIKDKLYATIQGGLIMTAPRDEEDFIYFEFGNVSAGLLLKL
jgi:hypothetical protein